MSTRPSRPAVRLPHLLTALCVVAGVSACGGGDPKPGPEVAGGNAGIDESVGAHLKVLDVEIAYPEDGEYEAGDDARLYLAISNTGTDPDALVDVTGPDFTDVRSTAGPVSIPVAGNDTVYVGAEGEPALTLVDLRRPLRSSQFVTVTFVFEHAGAVTVDAVVDPAGEDPRPGVDFSDPAQDPTGQN